MNTYRPRLESWTEVHSQDTDTNQSSSEGPQILFLEALNSGASPDGNYLIIKTERWALDPDEIDAFAESLKKFINRPITTT